MSPLISAIDQRRGGRTRLTVDGEEHELPTDDVLLAGLRPDQEIEHARWEALRRDGRRRLAVRQALQIISRRSRTESDVRSRLGREFDPDAAAYAAARLRELGYVDDHAWAQAYLERPRSAGRSRTILRLELRRHGVPDETIEAVLADRDDPQAAVGAARVRWRQLRRRDPKERDRLLRAYLYRRGFAPDEVSTAMRVCAEDDLEAEDAQQDAKVSGGDTDLGVGLGTDREPARHLRSDSLSNDPPGEPPLPLPRSPSADPLPEASHRTVTRASRHPHREYRRTEDDATPR